MGPEPASSKTRGSRYRSNEAQPNHRAGDSMERVSQRAESGKSKSDRDGGGTESGRGVKRRQHGGGGDGGQGGTPGSISITHRSSKRSRGDALETLDAPISTDRWDGGPFDTHKENAFPSGKGKQESEARSLEGIPAKGIKDHQLSKAGEDLDKASRKQKVSKGSLVSESRAITVMDLQETDVSIIDCNIRIKNKVVYAREATSERGEPVPEKSVEESAKNAVDSLRSRRRWDRDGHRGGADVIEDVQARGNVGRQGSQERDKRKEKSIGRDRDRDRDAEARLQNGGISAEGTRDLVGEVDGRLEIPDELDISNDFKIQEELRNIELEKELENRIRRRREESGDRDRWRDDDRERDGKRHSDSRERDERPREERHSRSRRDRERNSDRYESRQHREGSKVSEGRQRDDRYYESDREYRSHREERYPRARSKDLEDQARSDRNRDQDHRDRRARDSVTGYEAERRASREKGPKEDQSDRERSYPTTAYVESPDGSRSELRKKRVRESDGEGYGLDKDHTRQRGHPDESDTMTGNGSAHDDRPRRSREDRDAEGRGLEGSQGSPRDVDSGMQRKGKVKIWCSGSGPSEIGGDGLSSPQHDARGSPSSNFMGYMSSPHLDDQRSPRYHTQRSPSHTDRSSGAPRGRTVHGEQGTSSSGGSQRRLQGHGLPITDRRDRPKWNSEEEGKGGIFRGNRGPDEGREGSLSPHRRINEHLSATQLKPPLHGQDSFPRGMGIRGMMEARSDRGGWRGPPSGFDGGAMDHHGPDELSPRDRNDRVRRMPMNRPPGSPMVRSQGPQMSSLPAPSLAPLPPPPPFRPGIDNPSVLGHLNSGFDGTGGSREQGRGERKGGPPRRGDYPGGMGPGEGWRGVNMGNWNARNQGPLPGNAFPPFPPHFGHPPAGGGGFPGMGQQFPGPHMFPGGGRPLMDMGFGGGRFLGPAGHMGEGGDGYLGLGRGAGWHGPGDIDDGRGPPLLGPGDGWEGPGPLGDGRLRHGPMEWERGGPMGMRGWERDRERDMWEARRDGAPPDFMPHHSHMDPPQNQHFPPPGSGWGVMPRDGQVPNDMKPLPDHRQSVDLQEVKRKPDGGGGGPPKPKAGKLSVPGAVSTNEGRLLKYATATMQSVLSQLDISPDLAGPELYAQYRALLPPSASGKQSTPEEEENSISEPRDNDSNLETDPEAESLIAGPNLLAKLLPPLPDFVFQEALRLYRKPETENRVLKSSRGSFVLPFDPSTIILPSVSLRLNRYSNSGKSKDDPQDRAGGVLDPLKVNVLHARFTEEFVKRNDELLNAVEQGQEGLELEGAEMEERGGDEFNSSHVEVAEYSDREFETEMEDTLEDESLKGMQVGGAIDEDKDSVNNMVVYKESFDHVATLVHANESVTEADDKWQVMDIPSSEKALAEMEDPVDNVVVEALQVESTVVKAYQVDNVVVVADQGDNVVVQAYQVDSVAVQANQEKNVVVQAYQVDRVVVEADQLDSVVVEANQEENVVVQAYEVDSGVVEADQGDNVVVQAYQVDSVVVQANQEKNVVVQAYQVDSVVVEADRLDSVVVEANQEENVVVQAYEVDSGVVEADQGDNVVVQAYQVDSVVVEAKEGGNVVVHACQVDSIVVEADQRDNVVVQAYQVDARMEEVDQVDDVVEETDQVDDVVEETDQMDIVVFEADQGDNLVVQADQMDTRMEEVDQVDDVVKETDQVDNAVEKTDQVDNAVEETDQVDNVVEETDQVDSVVFEADQGDNAVVQAYQMDTLIEKVDKVDNVVEETDQVESVVFEADQGDNVVVQAYHMDTPIEKVDEVDTVVEETDQVDKVVEEAFESDTRIEQVDQVGNVVEEADRMGDMVDEADKDGDMVTEGDLGENVNSSVVNYPNSDKPEKNDVVKEDVKMLVEETIDPELIQMSETSTGELVEPQNVQIPAEKSEGFALEVPVSKEVIEAEDNHKENLDTKSGTGVEDEIQEAVTIVKSNEEFKDVEEGVGVSDPVNGESNGLDRKQAPPFASGATETIQNHLRGEILTTVNANDRGTETNGKLKEIVENSPAPEQPAIEESQSKPLTRLRKRRVSGRLQAQQALEAQAAPPLQEPSDGLVGQGTVEVKKQGPRGSTRTSQRRSKRRGSTH